eukprot:Gb_20161 [translate_table: standard]
MHFRWECLGDKKLRNNNDIYHEVEKAESLYAKEEEISEDDANYKTDLLSIKVIGLQKIAIKPKVLPCKDLFSKAMYNYTIEKGILGSPKGNVAIISGFVFLKLYKVPQPGIVYNADLSKAFLK